MQQSTSIVRLANIETMFIHVICSEAFDLFFFFNHTHCFMFLSPFLIGHDFHNYLCNKALKSQTVSCVRHFTTYSIVVKVTPSR